MKILICLVVSAASIAAQTSVAGPEIGFVYDSRDNGVHPMSGIPASAMVGERLPVDLDFAVGAPNGYAIGVERGTGATVLVSGSARLNLPGTKTGAAAIAIGPRGRTAAVYFPGAGIVQIFSGLPSTPRVTREIDLEGRPSALAVSDDAEFLLASVERDGEDSLVLLSAATPPQVLLRGGRVTAVDFVPGSGDAVAAGAKAVWLIRDGTVSPLLDERDGVADPVGVAASSDGGRLIVALRGGQVLLRDLTGGSVAVARCNCEPSGLARLRGNSVFRLNDASQGTVWLFDADGAEPRIVFVAAAAESAR